MGSNLRICRRIAGQSPLKPLAKNSQGWENINSNKKHKMKESTKKHEIFSKNLLNFSAIGLGLERAKPEKKGRAR